MATDQEIILKSYDHEKVNNEIVINLIKVLHERNFINLNGDVELYNDDWDQLGKPSTIDDLKNIVNKLKFGDYYIELYHAGEDGENVPHNRLTDVANEIVIASGECANSNDNLSIMSVYGVTISIVKYGLPSYDDYEEYFAVRFGGDGALDNNCILEQLHNATNWSEFHEILNETLPFTLTLQSNVVC